MTFKHKDLAQGRWATMSLHEQMANIGSEVSRAFNWQKKAMINIQNWRLIGHWSYWI